MQITHLGHACLLIETAGERILVDPGNLSPGYDGLTGLDAIVVTHQHPDHFDPERAPRLIAANPGARLMVEPETVAARGLDPSAAFAAGSNAELGDVSIASVGGKHARIHDKAPIVGNVGVVFKQHDGPTLFHPGDSYADAPQGVDILALPLSAPWTRVSETLDFVRAVSPAVIIPIHDAILSPSGRSIYLMHVATFGPEGADVIDLRDGEPRHF